MKKITLLFLVCTAQLYAPRFSYSPMRDNKPNIKKGLVLNRAAQHWAELQATKKPQRRAPREEAAPIPEEPNQIAVRVHAIVDIFRGWLR